VSDQGTLLFDRAPIGVYRATADGTFKYVNNTLARLLGFSVEELMARNLNTDIHVDPTSRPRRIERYVRDAVVDGIEDRWRTKDGHIVEIQLWGHVVQTDSGLSFEAWVVDITAVKRQREELERTAFILDQVVRQMPAMYWVVDRDLKIMRTGGAVREILGAPAKEFIDERLPDLQARAPGSTDPTPFHQRALAGEVGAYDTEFAGKHLTIIVSPYRSSDGSVVGAIGTALDVTQSRMLERRMVDAQRAESLGVLAGGLAHDFNNLLLAVIGNADLALRDIPRGIPGRAAIETIRDAGLRAAELTDQLLTVSGRGPAGTTRVYPTELVEELVRITAPSIPESIRVDVDIPRELALRGDPAQLRQVMLNLISNARDALAGSAGVIAIRARLIEHDGSADPHDVLSPPTGSYIAIEVADDGAGMSADVRRHVFDPFFTTKPTGHGLGLAAMLGIVRAHGGGLRLESSEGHGATFTILWPAADAPASRPTPPPLPPKRTVLVIDDEDLVRDVVARMIEDLGYSAITARDGQTALDLFDQQPVPTIDAVLVDMTMPRMTGADVIAALRTRHPGLPVILCSGFDRGNHGPTKADAYLPKPFRIDALERTLAKLLPQ
jgi:two-component system, cell cycle sensor histidine kinase and response regulator CckA